MHSSGRTTRTIIPKCHVPNPAHVKLCSEHDATMFKDPAHVRQWMATATNGSSAFPGITPSSSFSEQAIFDEGYAGLYATDLQGPPLDFSAGSYDAYLYGADFTSAVAPMNFHSDSVSSEDESILDYTKYDAPGPVDMAYTKSNQSTLFPSDFSTSSGIVCTTIPGSQAQFSAPTAWSSPSSIAMEPRFPSSYTAPGFLPCVMNSPQPLPLSRDFRSGYPGYDDTLPAPMLNAQVQSPVGYSSNEVCTSTIRPARTQTRGSVSESTFWPPSQIPLVRAMPTSDSLQGPSRPARQISGNTNPRDHHLYNVEANIIDHLYYCPFGPTEGCRHKADKLKCNYDKHLDSHLKPYRCKYNACSTARFSSTACLLRHEREAHGMHGHGSNPFRCPYEECDRGRGFPRRYNLEDHMKRMHGFEPTTNNRRKSQADADVNKIAAIRGAKRRSVTIAAAAASSSVDQTGSKVQKYSSSRASGTSRRRSFQ